MVWMLSRGLRVRFGVAPAASVTIIVSPMARESAKINDATIPESAAGTTTRVATSNLVEPRAYAPARSESGTAIIASSLREETMGMSMIPRTMLALRALKTDVSGKIERMIGVTKVRAKYP